MREKHCKQMEAVERKKKGTWGGPNQQRWHAKMEAQSGHVNVAYTSLHVCAPILFAWSALIKQNICVGAQEEVY